MNLRVASGIFDDPFSQQAQVRDRRRADRNRGDSKECLPETKAVDFIDREN